MNLGEQIIPRNAVDMLFPDIASFIINKIYNECYFNIRELVVESGIVDIKKQILRQNRIYNYTQLWHE